MTTNAPDVDVESNAAIQKPLLQRVKSVRSKDDAAAAIGNVFGKCCGSVVGLALLGLFNIIPIASIVIGILYLDECPGERMIPIYLIVGGIFALIKAVMSMFYRVRAKKQGIDPNDPTQFKPNPLDGILNLFIFAWFIAGSVWVYRIFKPDSDECNPVVYYYSFVTITLQYVILGLALFVFCCCCCCIVVAASTSSDN